MIADHFTVFCVRKKIREKKHTITETVRDYKKFNKENFCNLIDLTDWFTFDTEINPVTQWNYMYKRIMDILAIMCPYKVVHTRIPRKKWLSPEIFELIREKRRLIKSFKLSGHPNLLNRIRKLRNKLNSSIDKAKGNYVKNLLYVSRKDPKRFWRNIKYVIENVDQNDVNNTFVNPDTGQEVPCDESCDFVNAFFANIAKKVCDPNDSLPFIPGDVLDSNFEFMPPETYEIMLCAEKLDVNSSSGFIGLNTNICKILLMHVPEKMRMIYANSMFTGVFPETWAVSTVKLLPKSGDLTHPGNWRTISMTNVFSKILENLFIHSYCGIYWITRY